ncbi:hypothetical protein CHISP_2062 [Chitinispirillum alkaliphilum]|nr:hypothetical protein CHISP_2062 [Chitinispirillum alkaliphilum]
MRWIFGIYPDYISARKGAGLLLKEETTPRGSVNVILSQKALDSTTPVGRGADFREITGDTKAKAAAGKAPDIKGPQPADALSWFDHFVAGTKSVHFSDAGTVHIAGEVITAYFEETVSQQHTDLSIVLSKTGLGHSDAATYAEKLKHGAVLLWIRTDQKYVERAISIFEKGKAQNIVQV